MRFARFLAPVLVGAFLLMGLPPAGAQADCPAGTGSSPPTAGRLTLGAPVVGVTGTVTVSGGGFAVASDIRLSLLKVPLTTGAIGVGSSLALLNGAFSQDVALPAQTSPGIYTISAVGTGTDNSCRRLGSAPVLVSQVLGERVARLTLGSATRRAGDATSATGNGCAPNAPVTFGFDTTGNLIGTTQSDAQGGFSGTANVPASAGVGQHGILASCSDPTGAAFVLNSTLDVQAAPLVARAALVHPLLACLLVLLMGAYFLVLARRSYRASARY
jgi:hypothetical protein